MRDRGLALLASLLAACSTTPAAPTGAPSDAGPDVPDAGPGAAPDAGRGGDAGDAGGAACTAVPGPFAPLSTRCGHFVDAQGRVVILHGINARVEGVFDVALDMGRTPVEPIPPFAMEDALRMRALGFNLLRLPLSWSGVEPTETDGFDETYLGRVAAAVTTAGAAGLLVLLDFHQDAYSKEIGEDGAPRWAIVPAPDQLLQGPLADLGARRGSPQVLRAFGTFFGDSPDGVRLRARFAAMAAHVASRFAGNPSVLGYEVYNEPIASETQVQALAAQVGRALRAADPGHLVAFEPDVTSRLVFDHSAVPDAPFPVPGGVYAPHTYTLAFSATAQQIMSFTRDTLEPAVASARDEATAWGTPLLITEWGYGPNDPRAADYAHYQGELQDRYMASAAYWLWKERVAGSQQGWGLYDYDPASSRWTERPGVRRDLARVQPEAIAGVPESYGYDRAARRFTLTYAGSAAVTAPTRVYVPAPEDFAMAFDATCDGQAVTAPRDPASGVIEVRCAGVGRHVVTVTGR